MSEKWELNDLLQAGWSPSDLEWEQAAEAYAKSGVEGDAQRARESAGLALRIAREAFRPGDPRLATSVANQAQCIAPTDGALAEKLLHEACLLWQACGPWIDAMQAPRVARSSMFHMRMEQRHRDTYRENWRSKWHGMSEKAMAKISDTDFVETSNANTAKDAWEQWQRERPAMLNDTRKLMAAVYLLLPGLKG